MPAFIHSKSTGKSPKSFASPLPDVDSAGSSPPSSLAPLAARLGPTLSSLSLSTDSSSLTIHEHRFGFLHSTNSSPTDVTDSPLKEQEPATSLPIVRSTPSSDTTRPSAHWWRPALSERESRPWRDPSPNRPVVLRRDTVPPEQTTAYNRTALAVAKATGKEVWEGTKVVAHDVLEATGELAGLAPVPGLQEAISSLLKIWDFVQQVESNRMACLHLVERSAGLLTSVRLEVHLAGADVEYILSDPLNSLVAAFATIEYLMQKQAERPFIKRYLKRDSILGQIQECHEKLTDSLNLFGLAVQVRILKEIKAQQSQRIDSNGEYPPIATTMAAPSPPAYQPTATVPPQPEDSSSVLPNIVSHHQERFNEDCHLDNADLKRIIRQALSSNSDKHLIEILQVQMPEMAEAIKTLQRALEDPHLSTPSRRRSSRSSESKRDRRLSMDVPAVDPEEESIHREFIEEEIGALRRLTGDQEHPLPPWTITRWEIDRNLQIGVGYFSEVYKGTWKDRTVAIKILAPTTPASLFLHEAQIWQTLKHPNVLELLGASSTSSNPPWFFVSPYQENGSLVHFLKEHPGMMNPLQLMNEIAVGMEYLHGQGVLHGDLKAVNVLIDDEYHCVISDFGQSELKSEAYRLSGAMMPRGTLRWLAPELMDSYGHLTWQADVYAFAICCIEILTDGAVPWPMLDDVTVRHMVVDLDERPAIPMTPQTSVGLNSLIQQCWERAPDNRPAFSDIAMNTGQLLNGLMDSVDVTPRPKFLELANEEEESGARSPSLHPTEPLQTTSPWDDEDPKQPINEPSPVSTTSDQSFTTTYSLQRVPSRRSSGDSFVQSTSPVLSSEESSAFATPLERSIQSLKPAGSEYDGYESPIPNNEVAAERRDERRYRHHLAHPYHVSLNLPLWTPSLVQIGDIGFHKRPQGSFVRLFNAFDPVGTASSHGPVLPPLTGVHIGTQREEKRSALQKGIDWVGGFLRTPRLDGENNREIVRQYTFLLRAGHKRSIVVAESAVYHYMMTLDAAKDWFQAHYDEILETYGHKHKLQKEDLLLVIGTLDTRDYALFVNHYHPDGHAQFNIYADRREGEPFGVWTTDTKTTPTGPQYNETAKDAPSLSANKVSIVRTDSAPSHTLVLARLRFKPDSDVPTSL